jgi:serine phosphatase RsbU (regulator of sigma subunit)
MKYLFTKILFLFCLLIVGFPFVSIAQQNPQQKNIDSLQAVLKTEISDTTKATIYNKLADYYRSTNAVQHKIFASKGIALSRAINFSSGLGNAYNEYAMALENEGSYENALSYYDSSLTKWTQVGKEEEIAKVDLNMANTYNHMANYPSAADYVIRSLKIQEKLNNTFGVAVCKLTLGNVYFQQNDLTGAIKAYEEARVLNNQSQKNPEFEGSVVGNIGGMFEQLGQHDSALFYFRAAISIFAKNGLSPHLASTYDNMGTSYKELGQYDSSKYYSLKGLALNQQFERPEGICNSLLSLGSNERENGSPDSALVYYSRGLAISKQIGTRDLESEFYYGLSKVYEKKKDFEKSLDYLRKYMDLNDSLHGQEQTMEIEKMKKGYEIDKKNRAMMEAATQTKLAQEANRRNTILFICGSILLLVVIVVIFLMLRNKQKHNSILERKNDEISYQKEEITASITYARRIQQSVMPDERILKKSGLDYFILNKPRDIVSGDFYWLAEKGGRTYIAVADCTGHGVPGALVSVIGINMLNKIIEQPGIPSPSEVLEFLHVLVLHALNKDMEARDTNDGMDIALLCIDTTFKKALFSGAGRPLYYIDQNGFHFIKGDRYSIAGEKQEDDAPYTEYEIPLNTTTTFYLSSDGYVDQFGEATGKKYLSKKFNVLLEKVAVYPMAEQAERIDREFTNWKGSLEQVDDVLVLGIRV